MKFNLSYAQNREDVILDAFLSGVKKGFYIDVGAADPVVDSVTKAFYDRGWKGINVEPNVRIINKLNKQRKRDININKGLGSKKGKQTIRIYSGEGYGLSTFSEDMKKEYEGSTNETTAIFEDIDVEIDTLASVCREHKVKEVDFLKIDVEGAEEDVLKGGDWKKYRPKIICIEANHVYGGWKDFIVKQDYSLVFDDGLNNYFVNNDNKEITKGFSGEYLRLAVGQHVIRPELNEYINDKGQEIKELKSEVKELMKKNIAKEHESAHLRNIISSPSGVRGSIRMFIRSVKELINKKERALEFRSKSHKISDTELGQFDSPEDSLAAIRLDDYSTLTFHSQIHWQWRIPYLLFHWLKLTLKIFVKAAKGILRIVGLRK